jgi:DNA adenine methylase
VQYLGGKNRTADQIAEHVSTIVRPTSTVYEPFCGGLSVSAALAPLVKRTGARLVISDVNAALIETYKATIERRWKPPLELTESEYSDLKAANDPCDPMTAFAAAGCSYGGKWWGGYARCARGYDYVVGAARSLERKCDILREYRVEVVCADFWSLAPRSRDTVYSDPPYADSVGYSETDNFDHEAFWARCSLWHRLDIGIRVSEYSEPPRGWVPAATFGAVQILGRSRGAEKVRPDVLWKPAGAL